MSSRLRVIDFKNSRGPAAIGMCARDCVPTLQSAETRLINCKESGEEGWYGTWAEMAFNISRSQPYITTPRTVARLQLADVCGCPVDINNQFYEYLRFGNGRMQRHGLRSWWHGRTQAYTRNSVATFVDIGPTPQFIQMTTSDPADITNARRVLLQGTDLNGMTVYGSAGTPPVQYLGEYNTLASPAISPTQWKSITGIQKDVTQGVITFTKIDPTTGEAVPILTMEPSEQVAGYRRYYFHPLPWNCCGRRSADPTQNVVTVTAICKLEPLPLVADTDYLLLQGDGALEAYIEECQSIRYSTMDTVTAKQMSRERHAEAVSLLNGTLTHYVGKETPAVSVAIFGSARLEKQGIGSMM